MSTLLAALLLALPAGAAGPKSASLVALIANPERYDGKTVRVIGYAVAEFEGTAVYLHREDHDEGLDSNGLWLELGDACAKKADEFKNGYALLEGVVDAKNTGHMGLWSAALVKVTRCEPWAPPAAAGMRLPKKLLKAR